MAYRLIVVLLVLLLLGGCASAQKKNAIPTYPCPSCGYLVDMNNVNQNIRMENKCSNCGNIFFYIPAVESDKMRNYSPGYGYSQGIRYGWPYYGYRPYQSRYSSFHSGSYEIKQGKYWESESWSWLDSYYSTSNSAAITQTTKNYHYP